MECLNIFVSVPYNVNNFLSHTCTGLYFHDVSDLHSYVHEANIPEDLTYSTDKICRDIRQK